MAPESPPSPTATGSLAKTPLAHLLVYVLRRRLDGTLMLQGTVEDEHAIFFKAGMPALVRTLFDTPSAGEVAVRLGFIDDATYRETLQAAGVAGFQHLELLKSAGKLTLAQYQDTLREHLHDGLLALCRSLGEDTHYDFHLGVNLARASDSDAICPIDPYPILWRAVSCGACDRSVGDSLARLGSTPIRLPADAVLDDFGFRREEQLALEALQGSSMSLERLISMGFLSATAWRRLVYVLLITRNLEVEGSGRNSLSPPPPSSPSGLPPAVHVPPASEIVHVTGGLVAFQTQMPEIALAVPVSPSRTPPPASFAPEPPPIVAAPASCPIARHAPYVFALTLLPLMLPLIAGSRLLDRISHAAETSPGLMDRFRELGPVSELAAVMPGARLEGAHLTAGSFMHWIYGAGAAVLLFGIAARLFDRDESRPWAGLRAGALSGVAGYVVLQLLQLAVHLTRARTLGDGNTLSSIVALFSYGYHAPLDPEVGFFVAALAYTLVVALWLEALKAIPILTLARKQLALDWAPALAVGIGSGIGFGIAQSLVYAPDHLNGLLGIDSYAARFISSTALHGVWSAIVALSIADRPELTLRRKSTFGWIVVLARLVPGVALLHGLYDTMARRGLAAGALLIAAISVGWFVWLVERARRQDERWSRPTVE